MDGDGDIQLQPRRTRTERQRVVREPLRTTLMSNFKPMMNNGPSKQEAEAFINSLKPVSSTSPGQFFAGIATKPQNDIIASIIAYKPSQTSELGFATSDTWLQCFQKIKSRMGSGASGQRLELIAVNVDVVEPRQAFSFVQKMLIVRAITAHKAYSVFKHTAILLMDDRWNLETPVRQLLYRTVVNMEIERSHWKPTFMPRGNFYENSSESSYLRFKLPLEYPVLVSRLSTYIWRPHVRCPPMEHLQIILSKSEGGEPRMIMICDSAATLKGLRDRGLFHLLDEVKYPGQLELIQTFDEAVLYVRDKIVNFLEKLSNEDNLLYTGRQNPSGSRYHYLQHLKDYLREVSEACELNRQALNRFDITVTRPMTSPETTAYQLLDERQGEMKCLLAESQKMVGWIDDARVMIKDELDLVQLRRTQILGVLAGLYIPMSFVTSFFGMNLQVIGTPNPFWTNVTTYATETPGSLLNATTNDTTLTTTKTASDAAQSWDIKLFWAISIPLTFGTILLPLVLGATVRWLFAFFEQTRSLWRLVSATGALLSLMTAPLLGDFAVYMAMPFELLILYNFAAATLCRQLWHVIFWVFHLTLFAAFISLLLAPFGLTWPPFAGGFVYWIFLIGTWWWQPMFYYRWSEVRKTVQQRRRNQVPRRRQ